MADAIKVSSGGVPVLRELLLISFNWPLFLVALGLMAAPVIENCRWLYRRETTEPTRNTLPPAGANLAEPT